MLLTVSLCAVYLPLEGEEGITLLSTYRLENVRHLNVDLATVLGVWDTL